MLSHFGWMDLRFESWRDEKAFKDHCEKKMLTRAVTILAIWHTLLLSPVLGSALGSWHVLLFIPTCLLGAGALLHVRAGWFSCYNFDWELIFIILGCLSKLAFPIIVDEYRNRTQDHLEQEKYFGVLGILLSTSHAIAIPFRASSSWVLLVSGAMATLVSSFLKPPEAFFDGVAIGLILGLCSMCWCVGWQLEERSRLVWRDHREFPSKLASIVPEETGDAMHPISVPHTLVTSVVPEGTGDAIHPIGAPSTLVASVVPGETGEGIHPIGATPALVVGGNTAGETLPDNSNEQKKMKVRHYLRIGATIPDFPLVTTIGNFLLSEFLTRDSQKPWSLLFSHPADFTPACTTEVGSCQNLVSRFADAGVKLIGLSCDPVEDHIAWSKDVLANANSSSDALSFPIIADVDKEIVNALGLLDPHEKSSTGEPLPARALVLLYNNTVKLTSLYPASCGRSFENVEWIISSLNPLRMSFALPAAPNPLRIGATIPDVEVTTTLGDFKLHEWLTADDKQQWTMLISVSHCTKDCESWRRWNEVAVAARKLGCKFLGITCDAKVEENRFDFPVILDASRRISTVLDILEQDLKDASGLPELVCTLVVLHCTSVKLSEIYPASANRNLDEAIRVLSSFRITAAHEGLVVTPANWHEGEPVLVHPSLSTEEARERFSCVVRTTDLPSGKHYLRYIDCPELTD